MKIINYDNRRIDTERLRREGRSDAYILGALDGLEGTSEYRPRKPKAPVLQVREIENDQVEVYGRTFDFREHFKRLGGR